MGKTAPTDIRVADAAATNKPVNGTKHEETPHERLVRELEEQRKKRSMLIDDIRRYKRRLSYKLEEQEAMKKLAEISKRSTKNIGYLRRKKESIEFRIATEAFTLEAERELIRKKNEIENELDEAIKSYRLNRKAEFIANDVEAITKKITESSLMLDEVGVRLDVLHNDLRRLNGESRKVSGIRRTGVERKPVEVILADIAVIKDEKAKNDGA